MNDFEDAPVDPAPEDMKAILLEIAQITMAQSEIVKQCRFKKHAPMKAVGRNLCWACCSASFVAMQQIRSILEGKSE